MWRRYQPEHRQCSRRTIQRPPSCHRQCCTCYKVKWLQWKEVKKVQKGSIFKLWSIAPLPGLLPQQQSWDARHDAAQQHVKDTRLQDISFKIFRIYRIGQNSKRTRWIPCQDHWQWCKWGTGCRNWHSSLNKNPFVSQSKTKQEYFGLFPWYIFLSQSFPLKKKIIIVTHIFRSHRSSCKDLASNLQLQPLWFRLSEIICHF